MGGGGGGKSGGSQVEYVQAPAPKQAATSKPVTEAATAARQSQRDKALKAAGIQGSILTGPMNSASDTDGKKLLGQ